MVMLRLEFIYKFNANMSNDCNNGISDSIVIYVLLDNFLRDLIFI